MKLPSPLEKLEHQFLEEKGLEVYIKRDDLIDAVVSGNKWRKLKYNFEAAKKQNHQTILTFGGAYSNHIAATARAGKMHGFKTIGIIRGEEQLPLNPTLQQSADDGMILHYVSRTNYRKKESAEFINQLLELFGDFYLIPEGGGNDLGVRGCAEIVQEIAVNFDYILTDCGTGATLSGLVKSLKPYQKAIGIPVLKGGEFIREEVHQFIGDQNDHQFELITDYHFGGYAKTKPELIDFMQEFYQKTAIKTDPVYTGKLFYALMDLASQNYFPRQTKIVVVHTGGLQGIAGFEERFGIKIFEE